MTSTRYPEWRRVFVERLLPALSRDPGAKLVFQKKLSAYFRGDLPHCKEIITSTLLCLLDISIVRTIGREPVDGYNTTLRVSCPWPDRSKKALRTSLSNGAFEPEIPRPAALTGLLYTFMNGRVPSLSQGLTLNSHAGSRRLTVSGSSGCRQCVKPISVNVGDKPSH